MSGYIPSHYPESPAVLTLMNNPGQGSSDDSGERDPLAMGEAALNRARKIAQRITEKVKKLTEQDVDTKEQGSLPADPTDVTPAIGDGRTGNDEPPPDDPVA